MNFKEALNRETVRNLMMPRGIQVEKTTPFQAVVAQLQQEEKFCAVILSEGQVVGIFTEQDALYWGLIRKISPETPIEQIMTAGPRVIEADASLATAINWMNEGGYLHLPVVDGDGIFLGLVSVRDVLRYLAEVYPAEVLNLPPNPHQVMEAPEGA